MVSKLYLIISNYVFNLFRTKHGSTILIFYTNFLSYKIVVNKYGFWSHTMFYIIGTCWLEFVPANMVLKVANIKS